MMMMMMTRMMFWFAYPLRSCSSPCSSMAPYLRYHPGSSFHARLGLRSGLLGHASHFGQRHWRGLAAQGFGCSVWVSGAQMGSGDHSLGVYDPHWCLCEDLLVFLQETSGNSGNLSNIWHFFSILQTRNGEGQRDARAPPKGPQHLSKSCLAPGQPGRIGSCRLG